MPLEQALGFVALLVFFGVSIGLWFFAGTTAHKSDKCFAGFVGTILGVGALGIAWVSGFGTLPMMDDNKGLLDAGGAYKVLAEAQMPNGKSYAQLIKRQDGSVISYHTSMSLPTVFTYTPQGKSHFAAIEDR